jgi:hypothetical protein
MRIPSVKIENVRTIENGETTFEGSFHALSGRKDAGKSDIIQAVVVATIVGVYALALFVLEHRIHVGDAASIESGLPLVTIGKPFFELGLPTQLAFGACALCSAGLIYALTILEPSAARALRAAVPLGALAMIALSMRTDFTNSDVYLYVYYGKTATLAAAYREQPRMPEFPPAFQGLRRAITAPIIASVYGPAWVELDRAIVAPTRSLGEAVRAIRIASAVALALTLLLVAALRLPAGLTAAIALNPGLYYSYVVQAHNDIYAILATLAGLVMLRWRSPVLAAGFGALAGALKLTVVFVALAVLTEAPRLRTRLALAAGILAGCAALIWLVGGSGHIRSIVHVGSHLAGVGTSAVAHELRLAIQIVGVGFTLVTIAAAVLYRRRFIAGSLVFPDVSGLVQPWYFPWGLAYAIGDRGRTTFFCTALPVLVFAADAGLTDALHVHFTPLIIAAIVFALSRELIRTRASNATRHSTEPRPGGRLGRTLP